MHTHKGIYCICLNEKKQLLTIEKAGGPYINRLDLPGGTPELGETEIETVVREVLEETGYEVTINTRIGERLYEIPWNYKQWSLSHHTAVFFYGSILSANPISLANISDQDSKGARWIDTADLNEEWCSPLVWEAVQYLSTHKIPLEMKSYVHWDVLDYPYY